MTEAEQPNVSSTAPGADLSILQAAHPKASQSVLFCVARLSEDGALDVGRLRELAAASGIRITAASVGAARRIMGNEARASTRMGSRLGTDLDGALARVRECLSADRAYIRSLLEEIIKTLKGAELKLR